MKYITSTIVRATDIALNGNLFGATLLKWLDEYGGLFAYKYLHHIFVTYKMGDTYFLKSAKLGELIDFYVEDVRFNKISVNFNLIAKLNQSGKEIIRTNMTFVSVDSETGKMITLNPFKFEKEEFEEFVLQKQKLDVPVAKPSLYWTDWNGNLADYKKNFLAELYLNVYREKTGAIVKIQNDWGRILEPTLIAEIIGIINQKGESNG